IDLDNTIISYDDALFRRRDEVPSNKQIF
ncbi:uncharacterized protein METZ01_LOCUS299363, partial [marine metagenome]